MASLREFQRAFARALGGDIDAVTDLELAPPRPERVNIYRNNHLVSLQEALSACFPVLERLVGPECFAAVAGIYVQRHHLDHGSLHGYGAAMPGFLAGIPELSGLPYLADIARLEWARQQAYHAAEPDGTSPVHPSVRLVESRFPIWTIWRVNQPDWTEEPAVDLEQGGESVAVYRDHGRVPGLRLSEDAATVLRALLAGNEVPESGNGILRRFAAEGLLVVRE